MPSKAQENEGNCGGYPPASMGRAAPDKLAALASTVEPVVQAKEGIDDGTQTTNLEGEISPGMSRHGNHGSRPARKHRDERKILAPCVRRR